MGHIPILRPTSARSLPMTRSILTFAIAFLGLMFSAEAQEYQGKRLTTPSLVAESATILPGKPFTVGVLLTIEPGWHTYWQFGGDSGAPTTIEWELPDGFTAGPIQWPLPTAHASEGDQLTFTYENEVMLLVEITPPTALPTKTVDLKASLQWLVCKETCVPGNGDVAVNLAIGKESTPANAELFAKWRAQLPKSTKPPFELTWKPTPKELQIELRRVPNELTVEFFPIPEGEIKLGHPVVSQPHADGARTIRLPYLSETKGSVRQGVLVTHKEGGPREGWIVTSDTPLASTRPPTLPSGPGLLAILWGAFLGGLILNLMPCVLPVIALKIFGFVQQAGEAPERVFRLGLAFVAGVFAFFLGLAALVAGFKAAGHGLTWGFQFQNPFLLAGLIALVFAFALAMFGVFEITISSDAATKLDSLSRKDGYRGAFVHGMFTTLLGTSCTAPLLGPVLGFAFVQPAHIIFLIFTVIAAGMSLPYFLLTWQPAWMRFLPKPGAWMEKMKQFMGFILLAVVIWLLGVFGRSHGIDSLVSLSAFLLVVAIASWIYGFSRSPRTIVIIVALIAGSWWFFLHHKSAKDGIAWEPFSPARVSEATGRGQAVFVDFTADWCLNCKANERFVLETEPVRAALRDKKILPLKADWTKFDPVITQTLKEFGRVGVPAYVLYSRDGKPTVLPEILTQPLLLEAFNGIK